MSSEEQATLQTQVTIDNIFQIVASTFLYWDHLMTLDAEILYYWKQPKSRRAMLFFFNRYFTFFANLSILVMRNIHLDPESCRRFLVYRELVLFIIQTFVSYIMAMRVYALYGCDRRVLIFFGVGSVLGALSSCLGILDQATELMPQDLGCHAAFSHATAIKVAVPWEIVFLYDTAIFCLTLYKTWRRERSPGDVTLAAVTSNPIISLMLRDGAIYFGAMGVANLASILSFCFFAPYLRGALCIFASNLSVTMISRLMLNLHQSTSHGNQSVSSISRFNAAMGLERNSIASSPEEDVSVA